MSGKNKLLLLDTQNKSKVLSETFKEFGIQVQTMNTSGAVSSFLSEGNLCDVVVNIHENDDFILLEHISKISLTYPEIPMILLIPEPLTITLNWGAKVITLIKPVSASSVVKRLSFLDIQHFQNKGSLDSGDLLPLIDYCRLQKKSYRIYLNYKGKHEINIIIQNGKWVSLYVNNALKNTKLLLPFAFNGAEYEIFETEDAEQGDFEIKEEDYKQFRLHLHSWLLLIKELPPMDTIFKVNENLLLENLNTIPEAVQYVLSLIDEERDIFQLLTDSSLSPFETAQQLGYLYFSGVLLGEGVDTPDTDTEYLNKLHQLGLLLNVENLNLKNLENKNHIKNSKEIATWIMNPIEAAKELEKQLKNKVNTKNSKIRKRRRTQPGLGEFSGMIPIPDKKLSSKGNKAGWGGVSENQKTKELFEAVIGSSVTYDTNAKPKKVDVSSSTTKDKTPKTLLGIPSIVLDAKIVEDEVPPELKTKSGTIDTGNVGDFVLKAVEKSDKIVYESQKELKTQSLKKLKSLVEKEIKTSQQSPEILGGLFYENTEPLPDEDLDLSYAKEENTNENTKTDKPDKSLSENSISENIEKPVREGAIANSNIESEHSVNQENPLLPGNSFELYPVEDEERVSTDKLLTFEKSEIQTVYKNKTVIIIVFALIFIGLVFGAYKTFFSFQDENKSESLSTSVSKQKSTNQKISTRKPIKKQNTTKIHTKSYNKPKARQLKEDSHKKTLSTSTKLATKKINNSIEINKNIKSIYHSYSRKPSKKRFKQLRELLSKYPNNPLIIGIMAKIFYDRGRLKIAKNLADKAVKINPNEATAWWVIGIIAYEKGNKKIYKSAFKKYITLNPKDKKTRRFARKLGIK